MNKKIGFIGSGKMASAIIKGLLAQNFTASENIIASQAETEGLEDKSKSLGIKIVNDNKIVTGTKFVIRIPKNV